MTIIVTGGAGFIGSNYIFYLLAKHPEDRIICLDKLTYAGNLSTLASVMDKPPPPRIMHTTSSSESLASSSRAARTVDSVSDPCILA